MMSVEVYGWYRYTLLLGFELYTDTNGNKCVRSISPRGGLVYDRVISPAEYIVDEFYDKYGVFGKKK